MELRVEGPLIHVRLSRRNLKVLLAKLEWKGSARTIERDFGDVVLLVTAEEDAEHYGDRTPGPMHPRTERDIRSDASSE